MEANYTAFVPNLTCGAGSKKQSACRPSDRVNACSRVHALGRASARTRALTQVHERAGDGEIDEELPGSFEDGAEGDGGEGAGVAVLARGVTGTAELHSEISQSYMEYAMSVILGRALPDLRDGLKPVHRRIVYAMNGLGLQPSTQHRKCARVVGEVLGKFHPHGDTAVYDALVRMSQSFSMSVPLVDGHGNFGSVDGDPPAAMRYTECRLTAMSRDALLADLGLETVDMIPNFDNSETEPLVLPARVPNLFLNGSTGIAVGMATNIPPHNLGELVAACVALIRDPRMSDVELLEKCPGPDFPTGGKIMGLSGVREMYMTGRGSIPLRSSYHFEKISRDKKMVRDAIIITELPYQVQKASLVERIAELVNDRKLDGIADLRDESDRSGMRVVIELKKDQLPEVVVNNMLKKTSMQVNFSANVLALDDKRRPRRLTLRDYLTEFTEFRIQVLKRRTKFLLQRARERYHIVQGFMISAENTSGVIETIRSSTNAAEARMGLSEKFGLSEAQAEAILSMQLRRLTSMERKRLELESKELQESMASLDSLLQNRHLLEGVLIEEMEEIAKTCSQPRRTEIAVDEGSIDDLALIPNNESVVLMTKYGFIKRMPLDVFKSQRRRTAGKAGISKLKGDDIVEHFCYCRDHDDILVFSNLGIAYKLPAYKVPAGSRSSRGLPLSRLIPGVPAGESVASLLPVSAFEENSSIVLLTKKGLVKKTRLDVFERVNIRGLRAIQFADGDQLGWVRKCEDEDSIIVSSRAGKVIRFSCSPKSLRSMGRWARGVRSMRISEHDEIVDMDIISAADNSESVLIMIASDGRGKRVMAKNFKLQLRGGGGVIALPTKKTDARVVGLRSCKQGDQIMIITSNGTINRQELDSIPILGRMAKGCLVQSVAANETVTDIAIVAQTEMGELDGDIDADVGEDGGEDLDDGASSGSEELD
ncbi:DNA gyrase subunit A [Porphyridium purpureum]|uniref:DNA topoisomerase (ATP-hydrolyzing) n=1 Tax=Porphyridium purpureum TaxID=35688 RepID=A0A5J4YWS5_PORPP|nr:DNA gyrase subunit A [Porphyridium purpureum]|eukprot:POR3860..scf209_3